MRIGSACSRGEVDCSSVVSDGVSSPRRSSPSESSSSSDGVANCYHIDGQHFRFEGGDDEVDLPHSTHPIAHSVAGELPSSSPIPFVFLFSWFGS